MRKIFAIAGLAAGLLGGNALGQNIFNPTGPGTPFIATGNGATQSTSSASRFGENIDVKGDFGATGNSLSYAGGTITSGTNTFSSSAATFTSADVGKSIIIDYAGVAGAPLITTISGFTDSHHVTLAANASTSVPYYFAFSFSITTSQSGGGSYVPGDSVCLVGGTYTTQACGTVVATQLQSASLVSGGSTYVGNTGFAGNCQVASTTGSGPQKFSINTVLSGSAISTIGSIVTSGLYTTNPTTLTSEPVLPSTSPGNGCTGGTGGTLSLVMGTAIAQPSTRGVYSVLPSSPISTTTNGSGTGLTVTPQWVQTGAFVYGTDDTAAFTAAWNSEITLNASGAGICINIPPGMYMISSPLPVFYHSPGCVKGTGREKTWIFESPALSGDMMSWSEAWAAVGYSVDGSISPVTGQWTGPILKDMSIIGDRTTINAQNAVMFYDRNDQLDLQNLTISQINGTCLGSGITKNTIQAYIRESDYYNIKMFYCGNSTSPVMLFDSIGSGGDATNEIKMDHIDIFAYFGHGLVFRSNLSSLRLVELGKVRIEGIQFDPVTIAADGMVIGDPTEVGNVNTLTCAQCEFIDPYLNHYALRLDAANGSVAPYQINIGGFAGAGQISDSSIGGGVPYGGGLDINYGRNNSFYFYGMYTDGPNVTMGSNASSSNAIAGVGNQQSQWTYNFNNVATQGFTAFPIMVGNPVNGYSISSGYGDGTVSGGNAIGGASVSLGTSRSNAYSVASGSSSVVIGGVNSQANNTGSISIGGNNNVIAGSYSSGVGGFRTTDRGWYGARCQSSGSLTDFNGDANFCDVILRCQAAATNGSTCQLTSDGVAANSANIANIPNSAAFANTVDCVAISRSTPGNNEQWATITGLETRGASAATTAWSGSLSSATAATRSNGTVTGSTLAITADTTNGGITVTFAAPTTNSALWDATCHVQAHQVQ